MCIIDGIKQDGKVEAPWILVANAGREAKKRFVRIVKRAFAVRENHLISGSGKISHGTGRQCGSEKR